MINRFERPTNLWAMLWNGIYRLAWAVLILWAVVPVMVVALLGVLPAAVVPMFGWRNYPLYARRYDRLGAPWWLPRPTAEARSKLAMMEKDGLA